MKRVNELAGIKESDTGLAVPALWDIQADKQALQTEEPLQVQCIVYINSGPICLSPSLHLQCPLIDCGLLVIIP